MDTVDRDVALEDAAQVGVGTTPVAVVVRLPYETAHHATRKISVPIELDNVRIREVLACWQLDLIPCESRVVLHTAILAHAKVILEHDGLSSMTKNSL